MKMRFLLLALMPFVCLAQDKEKECALAAKRIDSLVKTTDFDKAYPLWQSSKCVSESLYLSGEKILTYKLSAPSTDKEKQQYLAELLALYTNDDKNFNGNTHGNLVKKAKAMQTYKVGTPDDIYKLFDQAFQNDNPHFTDAHGLYDYFELYYNKLKAGDKSVSEENVMTKEDAVTSRLRTLMAKTSDKRDYNTAIDGIKALTNSFVTCEKLEAFYEKRFESMRKDTLALAEASENLMARNCTVSQTLTKMASGWYALQPGAKSAFAMGVAAMRSRNNQAEAFKYFDESASAEKDPIRKADTNMVIASIFTGNDNAKAIVYVKKAIEARPAYGKPYFMLAQLYVATGCGASPFEKKALFLLASETAMKAGTVDPTMKTAAMITSEKYLKKAPTSDEIKEAKKSGGTVTFGCGINQSVTFPK